MTRGLMMASEPGIQMARNINKVRTRKSFKDFLVLTLKEKIYKNLVTFILN